MHQTAELERVGMEHFQFEQMLEDVLLELLDLVAAQIQIVQIAQVLEGAALDHLQVVRLEDQRSQFV